MKNVLVVGLSPAIQKTMIFPEFTENGVSRSERYCLDASGKCVNVARVLTRLGKATMCLTPVGRDNYALFTELVRQDGIALRAVISQVPTRHCYTILNSAQHSSSELVVNEPGEACESEELAFRTAFSEELALAGDVVISGSRLPGFSESLLPDMVSEAKVAGLHVYVDYRGEDLLATLEQAVPDVVKINADEFRATFNLPQSKDLLAAITDCAQRYGNKWVITQGCAEILAVADGEVLRLAPPAVEVVNATGSGDTFMAALVSGLQEGRSVAEILAPSAALASRNVQHVRPADVGRLDSADDLFDVEQKLMQCLKRRPMAPLPVV